MPSHDLQRPAASRALLGLAVAAACLAPSSPASAQPTRLDERCIVSVLNRNVRVRPDGTWVLPNVPANFGMVRARATCIVDGQTISGESAPFLVSANGNVNLPRIVLGPTTPIPQRVTVTGPVVPLGQVGALAQLAVTARFADGTSRNVTAASTGTRYVISNPAIASITADGIVTALTSGTVLVQATSEGTSGFTSVRVVLAADSDGDGIPDDLELALGLNPNDPADGFEDLDRDGASNRDEALAGSDPRDPDSDDDTVPDGEELTTGADGFRTNPLAADTDGDGVRDGVEIATGSDPTNSASVNLGGALTALTVTPATFSITVNGVLGVGSQQLAVTGTLRDGTTLDLTSTERGTNYASSDLDVCNFGAPDGRVFGGSDGSCTITVTNSGFSATATATVRNFQPTALGSLAIPGFANNVDANGGFAYVAAGAAGLVVVNVSAPESPAIAATLDTPGNANDVRVLGNRAYVADGAAGLQIVDVTNPATPVLLGTLDTPGEASDVIVSGSLAYVADGVAGVHVVDVSVPATPHLVQTIDTPGTARGVDVEGTTLVVADDGPSPGLRVIDVSAPPFTTVGAIALPGPILDVDLSGGTAYVAAYTSGVQFVGVANPAAPSLLATMQGLPSGFIPRDVQAAGRFALFAEELFANVVAPIVDIGTPATPFFRGVLDFGVDYNGTGVAVSGPYVYVTAQTSAQVENGVTGTTRLFIGQYLDIEDRGGVAPTVTITEPASGASVIEGAPVAVRADASDDVAVASVTFTVNGTPAFVDTSEPFEARLTAPPAPGPMLLGAIAADFGGNSASAPAVPVTVTVDPLTTVVGRVTDRGGVGVGGATVTLLAFSATSATDGSFTFANVPTVEGNLVVSATATIGGRILRGRSAPGVPAPGGVVDVGAIRLAGRIGLLHCGDATAIRAGLVATGLFLADDIGELTPCAIPTLAQLLEFDAVLAWTDAPFSDPVAVGNVLGSYNDQGGGVVLATFAFTNAWRIAGVISNRSPFTLSGTMGGGSGLLNLAASMTSHPIMQGVTDTTQPYFTNANYTNPVLRMFSTLIAVDTTSRRVVAVSASGTVVGVNIFPGHALPAPIQRLFANALDFVR